MKKATITILMVIIQIVFIKAQDLTQTIRGKVIDKDSKSPMVGVNIILLNYSPIVGTISDLNGEFVISKVPIGRQAIKASFIGYKDFFASNLLINSGKEAILEIELEESTKSLDEITIQGNKNKSLSINEMSLISARTFSVEETGRFAGSMNDVSRMAANYAGVANGDDSRNDIIIRGNSPAGLLWRMEGMDIPSPNHFSGVGSNGGPVSMLNYNVISNSDFMTGAFSAEYGDALSGVFDIKLRNGNNVQREHMFQFGALGTELMLEGPFRKGHKGSYLVNYRFSTTTILSKLDIDFGYPGQADYQDISFKFNLPTKNTGTFNIFGLGGKSVYKVLAKNKDPESFEVDLTENTNDRFITGMAAFGISNLYSISNKTHVKTVLGITGRMESGKVDSVSISDGEMIIPYFSSDDFQTKLTLLSSLESKISTKNKFKFGFMLDRNSFNMKEQMYNFEIQSLLPYRIGNNQAFLGKMFAQWKYSPNDNLTFNIGLHYQYFFLNQSTSLEPRLGMKWNIFKNQSLNFGYGLHSQLQILPVYFNSTVTDGGIINTNKNLDFNKSHHIILGYNNLITENISLKIETYYQKLFNIPVNQRSTSFSVINEGSGFIVTDEDSLLNKGTGRNYGVELTLERFFKKGFYYLLTTSLFNSKYKGSDGIERNTAFNGNYVANFLAGKEFSITENNKLILDLKITYSGGRRFTPINAEASKLAGTAISIDNEAFTMQHKNYFRTDFKITYRINKEKVAHEIFLNIDNVFNSKNVFAQIYSKRTNNLEYIYQLGLFPTFQYKIMF